MSRPSREQALAWAAAATPLLVSLAGNVTWGLTTGSPILVVAGVVTPLLLVLAIERWRAMPTAEGGLWWVRTLAMSGVVVVVAGWSWLHTTALLLDEVAALHAGEDAVGVDAVLQVVEVVLCVLAPLAVDGLAVLSVLALDAEPRPDQTARQQAPDRSDTGPDRRSDAELLEILRAAVPPPSSRNAVMRATAVGATRADRLLAALADTPDRTASTNGHAVGARG